MSGYFSHLQLTEVEGIVATFTDKLEPEPEEPVFFDDASTSTTSLNEIPTNASASYPPPDSPNPPSFRTFSTYLNKIIQTKLDKSTEVSSSELEVVPQIAIPFSGIQEGSAKDDSPSSSFRKLQRTASFMSNRDSRCSFGVYESDTFIDGTSYLFAPMPSPIQLKPDGVRNPDVPPLSIICCKMYMIGDLAKSSDLQDKFFNRVFLTKLIQLLVVIAWLLLKTSIPKIEESITGNYELWFYIPSIVYVVLLISIRWIPSKAPRGIAPAAIICIIMAFAVALALGSVETRFRSDIFILTVLVLFCSSATIAALTWNRNYHIMSNRIQRVTLFIVPCITCLVFALVNFKSWDIEVEDVASIWLPVMVTAEAILMVYVLEVKCVIGGRRFPVSSADWLYAACFL